MTPRKYIDRGDTGKIPSILNLGTGWRLGKPQSWPGFDCEEKTYP
jgi:hypothetical protein